MSVNVIAVYAGVIMTLILLVPVKELKKDYAPVIVTALSVLLIGVALKRGMPLFEYIRGLGEGNGEEYFSILYKSLGIAISTQLISDMCGDFGAQSVAGKVELVGKIAILMTTVPLVEALLEFSETIL